MKALEVRNVSLRYDNITALEDVSLDSPSGKMIALIGPNGSGKTSLLRLLAGLLKPTAGTLKVLGREPSKARGLISYTPQREEVYWDYPITVRELVAMGGIRRRGLFRWLDLKDDKVSGALSLVGLEELADRRLSALSGGQQQRAFLARAICQGGEIYLLDEPISGLDAPSEAKLLEILSSLRDSGKTIVVSTHDISATLELFNYVALIKNRLIAYGPPQEVLTSENLSKTYGESIVALHLDDIKRIARWR